MKSRRGGGAVISPDLDLETVLSHIAQQMTVAIDATSAHICRYEPESSSCTVSAKYVSPQACARERGPDLGAVYQQDNNLTKSLQACQLDIDHRDDPDLTEVQRVHMQKCGARTILYIPLRSIGGFAGHVELRESRRRREFTAEEIAQCQDLAQQAAIALENARLHHQTRQEITQRESSEQALRKRTKQIELLFGIGLQLGQTLSTDTVYSLLHDSLSQFMDCDILAVSSFDPENQHIRCAFATIEGRPQDVSEYPHLTLNPDGRGTQSVAIRTGESQLLADYQAWLKTSKRTYVVEKDGTVAEQDGVPDDVNVTRSALIVPMKLEGEVVGVIQVQSYRLDAFTEDDLRILESLAVQVAAASNNALLYQKAQEELGQRKLVEVALRKSEQQYRALFEYANDAVILLSLDGVTLSANSRAAQMTGYSRDELVGMRIGDLVAVYEYADTMRVLNVLLAGETVPLHERVLRTKDEGELPAEINIALIYDAQGHPTCVQSIMRDITKRKAAENAIREYSESLEEMVERRTIELRHAQEEIVQKEEMATLGRLAAGVAHELRNPLGVISNAVYFIKAILPEADDMVHEYLGIMSAEGQRAEGIISALIDYTHARHAQPERVALSGLVSRVLESQHPPDDVRVVTNVAPDLPHLFIDPAQISQILTSLLTNAYQAMPDGGEVTIDAHEEKNALALSVADTGGGISPDDMGKVFDPLFTTRARGIGLGLAISKKLVEANGGSIDVESRVGQGTTFTLVLPTKEAQI